MSRKGEERHTGQLAPIGSHGNEVILDVPDSDELQLDCSLMHDPSQNHREQNHSLSPDDPQIIKNNESLFKARTLWAGSMYNNRY